jgi:putative ABC transport system ATP-binding protein
MQDPFPNLVPFLNAIENLLVVADLAGRHGEDVERRAATLLDELGLGHRMKNTPPTSLSKRGV